MRPFLPLLLCGLLLPARADILHPRQGPAVEGIVEEAGDAYRVRLPSGTVLTYPKSSVERVEKAAPPQEVFLARRGALAEGDAQARLELARWALVKGMRKESAALYEEVLRLSPGNAEALQALGYVQEGGVWMTSEEAHRLRGDRLLGRRWLAPAEFRQEWTRELMEGVRKDARAAPQALATGRERPADLDPGVLSEFLRYRSEPLRAAAVDLLALCREPGALEALVAFLSTKESKAHEASVLGAIRALERPEAGSLLLEAAYAADDEGGALRLIRAAGAVGDARIGKELGRLCVFGPSSPVRREAAAALAKVKDPATFKAVCVLASKGSPGQRKRAAEALTICGDPSAVPALIEGLERREEERAGRAAAPPLEHPFSGLGIGGAPVPGGKEDDLSALGEEAGPKLSLDERYPEEDALLKLTNQNFGKDAEAWRRWWASRK